MGESPPEINFADWELLVREHGLAVFRIAFRILGDAGEAEDVMQDVFCEAWRIQRSEGVTNWPGLLRRLAVLRALDRLRRRRPVVPLAEHHLAEAHSGPPEVAMARELAQQLRQCLRELPDQQAAAFSLFYFENLSRGQIAQALETTVGAVSAALSKARRSLKSSLSNALMEINHEQS